MTIKEVPMTESQPGFTDIRPDKGEADEGRKLPTTIAIPEIEGEMLVLRPATWEDCLRLDGLDAFHDSAVITGKSEKAERDTVHAWVSRSLAWSEGNLRTEKSFDDPEARGLIAWSMFTSAVDDDQPDGQPLSEAFIGMIFLVDIDAWASSARIQVLLGRDYRSRGFSRDAMPRVMTYGFAPRPAGLGLHRIWVAVPQSNSRSSTVYKSLGFTSEGDSRDALWDQENQRYQDLEVLGTLADEFDPIGSLEAFGMRPIMTNPGINEAMAMHEHSVQMHKKDSFIKSVADITFDEGESESGSPRKQWNHMDGDFSLDRTQEDFDPSASSAHHPAQAKADKRDREEEAVAEEIAQEIPAGFLPNEVEEKTPEKTPWWRKLGRGRKPEEKPEARKDAD